MQAINVNLAAFDLTTAEGQSAARAAFNAAYDQALDNDFDNDCNNTLDNAPSRPSTLAEAVANFDPREPAPMGGAMARISLRPAEPDQRDPRAVALALSMSTHARAMAELWAVDPDAFPNAHADRLTLDDCEGPAWIASQDGPALLLSCPSRGILLRRPRPASAWTVLRA